MAWRDDDERPRRAPLIDRYRPQTFEQIVGQPDLRELPRVLQTRRPAGILFSGPSGTGKTTAAGITARAILCENLTSSGSPCLACESCRDLASGEAYGYESHNGAELSVAGLALLLEESRYSPDFDQPKVYFIDEADRLHDRARDLLLTELENAGHRIFLFATTRSERLGRAFVDRVDHYRLELLDRRTRLEHLQWICHNEGFTYELDSLKLLADLSAGHARALVQNLDRVTEGTGAVTEADVRRIFRLGDMATLVTYLKALVHGDLEGQLTFNDNWTEEPATKAERLQEVLQFIYEVEVLRQHRPSLVMSAIAPADRQEIAQELAGKAAAWGLDLPSFWLRLCELLDPPAGRATPSWFKGRLWQLHQSVHGHPAAPRKELRQGPLDPRDKRRAARAVPRTRRQVPKSAEPEVRFLPKARAEGFWEAGSALMQLHGVTFNLRCIVRHERLGGVNAGSLDIVGPLLHELGQFVRRQSGETLHYAYLHSDSPRLGLVTTIVAWVPEALADEVDAWAFDSFLPSRFGSGSLRQAVQLRIGQPVARNDRVRRHWQLVRYLCRSLDPALQVRTEGGRVALVDCLGVSRRLREPQGRPPVVQTWRVSRTIGEDARKNAAREKLALLSALRDRAWSHLAAGWELDEHRDRCRWAAEREAARRDVELSWPSAGGDLGDQQRAAKMAELEMSWPDDPHTRERTWLGWWNIGIRSHNQQG